jgi:hypothetical protein
LREKLAPAAVYLVGGVAELPLGILQLPLGVGKLPLKRLFAFLKLTASVFELFARVGKLLFGVGKLRLLFLERRPRLVELLLRVGDNLLPAHLRARRRDVFYRLQHGRDGLFIPRRVGDFLPRACDGDVCRGEIVERHRFGQDDGVGRHRPAAERRRAALRL